MHPNGKMAMEVLLVEDNSRDVRLTEEALKDSNVLVNLSVAHDGDEALDFLRREGNHTHAPAPDLVLLDLSLPRKDGREVLREIKTDDHLKRIPVIVLTGSEAEVDIVTAYGLHANCYIQKPKDLDELVKIVKMVDQFWFKIVKLPPRPSYPQALPESRKRAGSGESPARSS